MVSTAKPAIQLPSHGLLEQSTAFKGKLAFSQWLDLTRWIAALSVVFAHSANRFFVSLSSLSPANRNVPMYLFGFLSGFAHEAVMIFFVLSGYLVGGGLWKESRRSHVLDLRLYFVKRLSRLCIVVYPALLLILLLNLLGIYSLHGLAHGIYAPKALSSLGPSGMACNASFLQTGLCEPYGDDGALWSLFNEFWYYVTWPLFLLGIINASVWKRSIWLGSGAVILLVLSLVQFKGAAAIGPYMLIWGLGILVAVAPRPIIRSSIVAVALFLISLLAFRLGVRREYGDLHPVGAFLIDIAIGTLFANMLLTLKFNQNLRQPPGSSWNTWLASFSFSLYCIHIPILNLYGAAIVDLTGSGWKMIPDQPWKWGITFAGMGLAIVAAYLFSRLTEAKTEAVRNYFLQVLGRVWPRELV